MQVITLSSQIFSNNNQKAAEQRAILQIYATGITIKKIGTTPRGIERENPYYIMLSGKTTGLFMFICAL